MGEVTTIGWTWRSMFFRCTGLMQRERRFCASSFGVRRFWRSSVDCRAVWLAWRRARRRTTGARELRALPPRASVRARNRCDQYWLGKKVKHGRGVVLVDANRGAVR